MQQPSVSAHRHRQAWLAGSTSTAASTGNMALHSPMKAAAVRTSGLVTRTNCSLATRQEATTLISTAPSSARQWRYCPASAHTQAGCALELQGPCPLTATHAMHNSLSAATRPSHSPPDAFIATHILTTLENNSRHAYARMQHTPVLHLSLCHPAPQPTWPPGAARHYLPLNPPAQLYPQPSPT